MITRNKDIDCLLLLKLDNTSLLNFICVFHNKYSDDFWNNFWRNKLIVDFPKRSIGFVNCKNPKNMYQKINKKSEIIDLSIETYPEIYKIVYDLYLNMNKEKHYEDLKNNILSRFQIFRGDTILLSSNDFYKIFYWDGEKIVDNKSDFQFPEFPIEHFFNYIETFCCLSKEKIQEAINNFNGIKTYITDEKGIKYYIFTKMKTNDFSGFLKKYPYIDDCQYIDDGGIIQMKYFFSF